ncbi:hypothetical protein CCMSSC00406_0004680 [Pleurotus cornucopiae]|uniref:Uncharacterized protein n=1 Tax=Pleurotus cornucopiae TaxID=5321 RepID=A0ACB7IYN7_PLECO|nr:hypothetical protein CCMSSC00406_0004680 [Pleurotus cornucopiae]
MSSLLFAQDRGTSSTNSGSSSPRRSPRKTPTEPVPLSLRESIKKRIIVCCDGTWQDGIKGDTPAKYTNVLRLARTISHEDQRFTPAIPQIVYYQSGVGTDSNLYSEYIEGEGDSLVIQVVFAKLNTVINLPGATGSSLADKVEEAYAFIAHNYVPGDEIFLFGFSRGAYTARMVAMFIGEIGVLDRTEMEHFAGIFIAYQRMGKTSDPKEIEQLKAKLAPWTHHDSPGKTRADFDSDSFSVKCIGVFDTVGSLGLPEEISLKNKRARNLFGFPDRLLGEHVYRAYQALALNEPRADFDCARFEQKPDALAKGQLLKQCWFTGSHSDIGGGYDEHDLSDITLTWMASQIEDMLALDMRYLASRPNPTAAWGKQPPHDPMTGVFVLAHTIKRRLPTATDSITHEYIHPSVLEQSSLYPSVKDVVTKHPELICELTPLEKEMKLNWPYKETLVKTTTEVDSQVTMNGVTTTTSLLVEKTALLNGYGKDLLDKMAADLKSKAEA